MLGVLLGLYLPQEGKEKESLMFYWTQTGTGDPGDLGAEELERNLKHFQFNYILQMKK